MSDAPSEDRLPDDLADKSRMHLQCVGSFEAHTQDGEIHTIQIWTHFGEVHDRQRHRVTPSLLVLTTTDGHGVDWVSKGQYRLTDSPEISLSADDPDAP